MALMPGWRNAIINPFRRPPVRPYPVVGLSGQSAGHTDPATFPFRLPTLHTPCHLPTARLHENASLTLTRSATRLDDRHTVDSLYRVHPAASHAGRRSNRRRWHPSWGVSKKTRARGKVPSFANRWNALVQGIYRDGFNETLLLLFGQCCCCCLLAPYQRL